MVSLGAKEMNVSPWPRNGRWFRFDLFLAWNVVANYDGETHKTFSAKFGRWPFFSWNIAGLWHGYVGYKPITLTDMKFQVPDDFPRDRPCCERSARMGTGGVS